jgi:hypothetical protein
MQICGRIDFMKAFVIENPRVSKVIEMDVPTWGSNRKA